MSKERELLKKATQIIESLGGEDEAYEFINEVKELLAQPEQEPVAWRYMYSVNNSYTIFQQYPQGLVDNGKIIEALYTSPQKVEQDLGALKKDWFNLGYNASINWTNEMNTTI